MKSYDAATEAEVLRVAIASELLLRCVWRCEGEDVMRCLRLSILTAGMGVLALTAAHPQTGYRLESIAKAGDKVGDFQLKYTAAFDVAALNSHGEVVAVGLPVANSLTGGDVLILCTGGRTVPVAKVGQKIGAVAIHAFEAIQRGNSRGRRESLVHLADNGQILFRVAGSGARQRDLLVRFFGGQILPLVVPGGSGSNLQWLDSTELGDTISVDPFGNAAFAAGPYSHLIQPPGWFTTYLWDFQAQRLVRLDPHGHTAIDGFRFEHVLEWQDRINPSINARGEIAMLAHLTHAVEEYRHGIFFRSATGSLKPVALIGQALPGGFKILEANNPQLNDLGVVAFFVRREEDARSGISSPSVYAWENGAVSPVVSIDKNEPGGPRFESIEDVWWVKDGNRDLLLLAKRTKGSRLGLYLVASGTIKPVAVPDQPMPGGGILTYIDQITDANTTGDRLLLAEVKVASGVWRALYRVDATGNLSRVLADHMTTELGEISELCDLSPDAGPNDRGQIAIGALIRERGSSASRGHVLLLTPTTQQQ